MYWNLSRRKKFKVRLAYFSTLRNYYAIFWGSFKGYFRPPRERGDSSQFFFLNKTQGLINTLLIRYKSSSSDNFSSGNKHFYGKFQAFRPFFSENCILCELKLSDDDDLYLVRSVLMRPSVLFKKKNRDKSLPSPGGRKYPQNDHQKVA